MKNNNILFPVKVPYSTAPDIVKLKDDFKLTPISDRIRANKLKELDAFSSDLFNEIQSDNLIDCLNVINAKYNLPASTTVLDLAMNVEEDIAILSSGKVIAICFCFPSGFIPSHVVGKSFFEIHQPIPDSDLLLKMSDKLTSMMADNSRGCYRRFVWTITSNPSMSQHPSLKNKVIPNSINDLYFRTESQTTIPLGDNVNMLFSVKVEMNPLNGIWEDHEKRSALISSIDSMSDAMLEYKNLKAIKSILNNSK
jgi:hypothetical protein